MRTDQVALKDTTRYASPTVVDLPERDMDFLKLLKSIEELLYEVVTWILFYPLTLAKVVRRPVRMMAYAEAELGDEVHEQYADALSPPIALLITLVLVHLLEVIVPRTGQGLPGILADDNNLIAFRAVAFSIFPLLLALVPLQQRGTRLTRSSLRPGFYAQCYAALPFVITFSVGGMLAGRGAVAIGLMAVVLGYVWYIAVQTLWQSRDGRISRLVACMVSTATVLAATAALFVAAALAGFSVGLVKLS